MYLKSIRFIIGSDDLEPRPAQVWRNAHRPVVQFQLSSSRILTTEKPGSDSRKEQKHQAKKQEIPESSLQMIDSTNFIGEINSFDLDDTVDGRNPAPPPPGM